MSLTLCTSCQRHVHDETCPFCGASVTISEAPRQPRARRSRFAIYGAAAAVATACGGSAQPPYGTPIPDASADAADAGDSAPATFYGAVFPDGGTD